MLKIKAAVSIICNTSLPEATAPRDIIPALQCVFKQIFDRQAPDLIEIDRAYRALRPPLEVPGKLQDIICKLHKNSLKEQIMYHVKGVCYMDFDVAKLLLFLDFSRCTLMQRRALLPLLEALQDTSLTHC